MRKLDPSHRYALAPCFSVGPVPNFLTPLSAKKWLLVRSPTRRVRLESSRVARNRGLHLHVCVKAAKVALLFRTRKTTAMAGAHEIVCTIYVCEFLRFYYLDALCCSSNHRRLGSPLHCLPPFLLLSLSLSIFALRRQVEDVGALQTVRTIDMGPRNVFFHKPTYIVCAHIYYFYYSVLVNNKSVIIPTNVKCSNAAFQLQFQALISH